MSNTLNSKLKVLVAKTFKAENLYSSLKNNSSGDLEESKTIRELANNLKAQQWLSSHKKLRNLLNEILMLNTSKSIIDALVELTQYFYKRFHDAKLELLAVRLELEEASKQEEFVRTTRLALDLVKYKAKEQSSQAIFQELLSLISSSGRKLTEESFVRNSNYNSNSSSLGELFESEYNIFGKSSENTSFSQVNFTNLDTHLKHPKNGEIIKFPVYAKQAARKI